MKNIIDFINEAAVVKDAQEISDEICPYIWEKCMDAIIKAAKKVKTDYPKEFLKELRSIKNEHYPDVLAAPSTKPINKPWKSIRNCFLTSDFTKYMPENDFRSAMYDLEDGLKLDYKDDIGHKYETVIKNEKLDAKLGSVVVSAYVSNRGIIRVEYKYTPYEGTLAQFGSAVLDKAGTPIELNDIVAFANTVTKSIGFGTVTKSGEKIKIDGNDGKSYVCKGQDCVVLFKDKNPAVIEYSKYAK